LSLYQAITKYQHLETESELKFPQSLFSGLTEDKLIQWGDAIDLLVSVGNACGHPYRHSLTGIHISSYSPELKEKATETLNEAIKVFSELKTAIATLRSIIGDEADVQYTKEQLDAAAKLIPVLMQIPELTPELLCEQRPDNLILECKDIIKHGKERDHYKNEITGTFTENILSLDAKVLLNAWNIAENKWFIPRYFGQKKMRDQLNTYIHKGGIKQVDIKNALTNLIKYQEEQKWINIHAENMQSLFARFAKPEYEQWDKIEQILNDFTSLDLAILDFTKDIIKAGKLKENISKQLSNGIDVFRKVHGQSLADFNSLLSKLTGAISEVSTLLNAEIVLPYRNEPTWINDMLSFFTLWLSHIHQLKDWFQWLLASRKVSALEIGFVAEAYQSQNIPANTLKNSFYKGFYRAAIDYIITQEPGLGLFKGKLFNDVISKYKELTDDFAEITQKELYAKLAANIPSFTIEAVQNSEVGILQRNIKNNGRCLSIRSLFDQIPTLLSRMCPCMLMSPISVAQYISPDADKFDLIIFDEASQMPTYEAVGAIARGKNMVIVGDPKQMPPTNFFSVNK
jgi:hypothetical protein